ncbi:NmrA-like family protein [Colletotrichum truncatum]|uniref:NmrA-like family protein n=1 Tax=Colletotrichum truncatum TaxID=5467 RepID=A0ACC3ZKK5_COLTU
MGVIAVAGGTGDVGRTIVEQLVASGKHPIVLCRKVPIASAVDGAKFVAVDYNDIEGLVKTLEAQKIDTIISAMSIEGAVEQAQLNLIAAADKSQTTRRFIPSEFAGYTPLGEDIVADDFTGPGLRAAETLAKSGLTFTRIAQGIFMDYFGQPNIPSHLRPFKWAIDVPSRRAAIPGTGNETLSLTYSKDLARFVDRLVDDDVWPEYSIICGADTTLNEIVAAAEEATGEKFDVTYDTVDDLKAGKATAIFSDSESYAGMDPTMMAVVVGLQVVEGKLALPKEGRLNDKYPDIQPLSINAFMAKAWSKKVKSTTTGSRDISFFSDEDIARKSRWLRGCESAPRL